MMRRMSVRTVRLMSSMFIIFSAALVACAGSKVPNAESARGRAAEVCGRGTKSCDASFDSAACNTKLGGITSNEKVRSACGDQIDAWATCIVSAPSVTCGDGTKVHAAACKAQEEQLEICGETALLKK